MAQLLLAKAYLIPILIFVLIGAATATVVHARWGRLWLGSLGAAVLSSVVWFALTAPPVLADGWQGFAHEWPHMLRAFVICTAINFPVALAVGLVMRWFNVARRDGSLCVKGARLPGWS